MTGFDMLQDWARIGNIRNDDEVWSPVAQVWRPAREVPDLAIADVSTPQASATMSFNVRGRQMQVIPVVVVDLEMPFASMVGFIVKWALASIPAPLIILFLAFTFAGVLTSVFRGIGK
ncbi:MAG TPA: hypothetical protein VNN25_23820 [Thermoanaerobaculia bacterium]|nr:hypothetical protein [Thermoanaerobaculia bacterium]